MYLGDGNISSHPRGVFKLRIVLDTRYPGLVGECKRAMRIVLPASRVSVARKVGQCLELYSYSRSWPCLFPQHGPGRKHTRRIALMQWQVQLASTYPEALLRGLIHSDGCRFVNTGRGGWRCPRYAFSNRSDDIRSIFLDAAAQLNLHTTQAPYTIYVSRKADVARMDEFIGPKR